MLHFTGKLMTTSQFDVDDFSLAPLVREDLTFHTMSNHLLSFLLKNACEGNWNLRPLQTTACWMVNYTADSLILLECAQKATHQLFHRFMQVIGNEFCYCIWILQFVMFFSVVIKLLWKADCTFLILGMLTETKWGAWTLYRDKRPIRWGCCPCIK
jgi:hypothetical protein